MISLDGSHTGPIVGNTLTANGDVSLGDGFQAKGGVDLIGSTIHGDLMCDRSQFLNAGGTALNADRLRLKGSAFLRDGFKAEGEVNLFSAAIDGNLECGGGQFLNKGKTALNAVSLKVGGFTILGEGFKSEGRVDLFVASIGSNLNCDHGHFSNAVGDALLADGLTAGGALLMRGLKAEGAVRLIRAVGLRLECGGGQFLNAGGTALLAAGLKLKSDALLDEGFMAEGEVSLVAAEIDGDLTCPRGQFHNKGRTALNADRLHLKGTAFLNNGFEAEGEVNLISAAIGGDLDCRGGRFLNPNADKPSLSADGLKVGGNAVLTDGFHAEGSVVFFDSTVSKYLFVFDLSSPESMILDLRSAKVGTLRDEEKSWPSRGNLLIDGFVYDHISVDSPRDALARKSWLRRQGDFRPQPYVQLAAVLSKSGFENDAKEILITKEEDREASASLSLRKLLWYYSFGWMIGYGYYPLRAFWCGLLIVILGWIVFHIGYKRRWITAKDSGAYVNGDSNLSLYYPKFNAFMYSVDHFTPVINLFQRDYWLPNAERGKEINLRLFRVRAGALLRCYWWFHIIMGWTITSLMVAGLLGLVRHD
jgi:hypothetical protein